MPVQPPIANFRDNTVLVETNRRNSRVPLKAWTVTIYCKWPNCPQILLQLEALFKPTVPIYKMSQFSQILGNILNAFKVLAFKVIPFTLINSTFLHCLIAENREKFPMWNVAILDLPLWWGLHITARGSGYRKGIWWELPGLAVSVVHWKWIYQEAGWQDTWGSRQGTQPWITIGLAIWLANVACRMNRD